jgi:TM2 domain-containing membrane protein YozV
MEHEETPRPEGGQPTPPPPPGGSTPPPPPASEPAPTYQQPPQAQGGYPQQYPQQQQPAPGPFQQFSGQPGTSPKNPVISLVASLIIPGLGQILNDDTQKGIIIMAAYFGSIILGGILLIVLIGIVLLLAAIPIWIYGMIDAYNGAKRWNVAHGFPAG